MFQRMVKFRESEVFRCVYASSFTCSKSTIKTPERRRLRSGVVIVSFEQVLHMAVVFLLLT